MTRTYGTIRSTERGWIVDDIEPHAALALKRHFPRIPRHSSKPFELTGGPSLDADLDWFLYRYPLRMTDADQKRVKSGTNLFREQQADVLRILSGDWKPSTQIAFRHNRPPYHYQQQAAEMARRLGRLLIMDDVGLGKEQPLTAHLLTPNGWRTMGDAHVGMLLTGRDGRVCRVTGVFPQGRKPAFKVTFTDGSSAECGLDHLWTVRDQNRRLRGKGWAVKPLRDIIRQGVRGRSGAPKWEIPLIEPADFAEVALPIPPYVLGVLIGDGYLTGPTVTFSVPPSKLAILERVRGLVGADRVTGPHETGDGGCPQYNIVGDRKGFNSLHRALEDACLLLGSKDRAIPINYLRCSAAARLELLRGLMDTDGSCRRNRSTYHTCSSALADGVVELVRSLGGIASARRYDRRFDGKPVEWQVRVRLAVCPFTLPYKASEWRCGSLQARPRRYIHSVEPIGDREQQCISVDAADHCYVTDDYIVTHNTVSALATIAVPECLPAAVVVPAHLADQWVEDYIEAFTHMKAHIIKKTKPYSLPRVDIYIFKYSNIWGWVDYLKEAPFRSVIFDEMQELRKGLDTAKGTAARVLVENAGVKIGLTASPVYNYGDEIWQICEFLDSGALGSFGEFVVEWCKSGRRVENPPALGAHLRDLNLVIRRTEDDAEVNQQLPPLNTIIHNVPWDAEVAAKSADLARQLAISVTQGDFHTSGVAAREFNLLMRHTTGVAKARHVAAYVRFLLESGRKVLLAGWHRDVYDIWLDELEAFRPVMFTGSESPAAKKRGKKAFIAGDTDLMIMSLRSGTGLDGLQEVCFTAVVGELDWSPQVHKQFFGRLRRPGQPHQVDGIYVVTDGGSDPSIVNLLGIKADQARGIVDPFSGVEMQVSDESRIKALAREYLQRQGIESSNDEA